MRQQAPWPCWQTRKCSHQQHSLPQREFFPFCFLKLLTMSIFENCKRDPGPGENGCGYEVLLISEIDCPLEVQSKVQLSDPSQTLKQGVPCIAIVKDSWHPFRAAPRKRCAEGSSAAFRAALRKHMTRPKVTRQAPTHACARKRRWIGAAGASRASWGALCASRAKPGLQTVTSDPSLRRSLSFEPG